MSPEQTIAALDARLAPIAKRPVDITQSGWMEAALARPPAVDEAGVREDAEAAVAAVVDAYAAGDETERAALRDLIRRHSSFAWAAPVPPLLVEGGLRRLLLWISVRDGRPDPRDVILELWAIADAAEKAGMDVARVFGEVAALSSEIDPFGFGSMRELLLSHAPAASDSRRGT